MRVQSGSVQQKRLTSGLILLLVLVGLSLFIATARAAAPTFFSDPVALGIQRTSATFAGWINDGSQETTYHWEYGTASGVYDHTTSPQTLPASGNIQSFQTPVGNLTGDTHYFGVLVATNIDGTATSNEFSFTTLAATAPQLQQAGVAPNGQGVYAYANFLANGAETSCSISYVDDANYQPGAGDPYELGQTRPCTPASQNGEGTLSASTDISGLAPQAKYHLRITLTNSAGSVTSGDMVFTTNPDAPAIANLRVEDITQTSANVKADIDGGNASSLWSLDYGTSSSYSSGHSRGTLAPAYTSQEITVAVGDLGSGQAYQYKLSAENQGGAVVATGVFQTVAGDPSVQINWHPKPSTVSRSAQFTFSGTNVARYECSVDRGDWTACESPFELSNVSVGDHVFELRGRNADGVSTGAVPAYWTVAGPAKCVLKTARTRLYIARNKNLVRPVIRYTSRRPSAVIIRDTVFVGKRKIRLPLTGAHFGKAGIYRDHLRLSKKQMRAVRHASRVRVQMVIPTTGGSCRAANSRRLTVHRRIQKQLVLFQSDSINLPGAPSQR